MSDTSNDAVASEPAGASPEPDATAHETDDASHGHGGHDDLGEHAAALGPIDWPAWGAGLIGVGAGLVVALCLYLATSLP